ncbi:MAG: hypothetical protein ACOYM3_26710 [Terrimicrobiaceae bacterium]
MKRLKANIRRAFSTEALVALVACFILIILVALTMRDKKPRFKFESLAKPSPSATATPAPATPAAATAAPTPVTPPDLQALFDQGRAESPLIAPVDQPPFVTSTDYANPPVYREIRENDLGKMYASAPTKDKRALGKVARVGGFRSAEDMAQAFGYPSVDQMVWQWDQTIAATPQFLPANFGTNASPPLPWQD